MYNIRLLAQSLKNIKNGLFTIFDNQDSAFKMSISETEDYDENIHPALKDITSNPIRLFHSSWGNSKLSDIDLLLCGAGSGSDDDDEEEEEEGDGDDDEEEEDEEDEDEEDEEAGDGDDDDDDLDDSERTQVKKFIQNLRLKRLKKKQRVRSPHKTLKTSCTPTVATSATADISPHSPNLFENSSSSSDNDAQSPPSKKPRVTHRRCNRFIDDEAGCSEMSDEMSEGSVGSLSDFIDDDEIDGGDSLAQPPPVFTPPPPDNDTVADDDDSINLVNTCMFRALCMCVM
jgi:hypothetical protein